MPPKDDLTGLCFGRLTVECFSHRRGSKAQWRCTCNCGASIIADGHNLKSGNTQSCGCKNSYVTAARNRTHGKSGTPEHTIWASMKQRCLDVGCKAYVHYGGRGISVFNCWRDSFEAFLADVGERPGPEYELDRIDNDGNYEPGNVRWATRKEQMRNTRASRRITAGGLTHTLSEWSELSGIRRSTIAFRIDKCGWSPEKAVSTGSRETTERLLSHDGRLTRLSDLAKSHGISSSTLRFRLDKIGMPLELALTSKRTPGKRKETT